MDDDSCDIRQKINVRKKHKWNCITCCLRFSGRVLFRFGQVLIARKTIFKLHNLLTKVLWKQCGLLLEDLWKSIVRILRMFLV